MPLIRMLFLIGVVVGASTAFGQVNDVDELMAAVNDGQPGDTILIGAGVFVLEAPLQPRSGMQLRGAGVDQTIIRGAPSWDPGNDDLPDNAVDHTSVNRNAYLVDLGDGKVDVTISDLTFTGARLHGAVYGNQSDRLTLTRLRFDQFLWSAVRLFRMDDGRVHDNTFIDAGGRAQVTSGQTGGALFLTFTNTSEFWNNRIFKTEDHPGNFFGFKGRKISDSRFHHNTVLVGFSLEFPFENDRNVEIDHNYFAGPISVPKFAGGPVYGPDQRSFHIHHNWLTRSYALEWARNSAQVNDNLFDFSTDDDGGNLFSNFGSQAAAGPTYFFNNRIRNPGRGVFWSEGPFDRFYFYNNHVRANTLTRDSGFFGFDSLTQFNTVLVRDSVFENTAANPRPLMRNTQSYRVAIENNALESISDIANFDNTQTGAARGPLSPFLFRVGVNGEYTVNHWNVSRSLQPLGQVSGVAVDTDLALTDPASAQRQRVKPFAGNDFYLVESGQSLSIAAPGVLNTDSNLHMGSATLTAQLTRNVGHGVLSLAADGSFDYVPDEGFVGVDRFEYQVDNGFSRSTSATVELVVGDQRSMSVE